MESTFCIEPVGRVRSPFDEKFAVPRQPGLAPSAIGEIEFLPPYDDPAMVDGLAGFSHVWLTFVFDRCLEQGWRTRVRPPRLGGNTEVGVFASRSPFRPNFLGLSAVRLLSVIERPVPMLRVAGLDLVDGTPIVDVRPYVPYADAIADAHGGFADDQPKAVCAVRFSDEARRDLRAHADADELRCLIEEVLCLDPRPAYRRGAEPNRTYGVALAGRDVRWRVDDAGVEVVAILHP